MSVLTSLLALPFAGRGGATGSTSFGTADGGRRRPVPTVGPGKAQRLVRNDRTGSRRSAHLRCRRARSTDPGPLATGDAERPGAPRNVVVLLLDSLNRHMLGSYGGTEFETPHLDRFARERAVRFTSHVTGSLPCMPARHDILCGSLDFLWRPWGSIEVWEEPVTGAAPAGRRHHHAGVGPPPPLRGRRRELPHRLQRVGLRARPRGRPVAHLPRPELHRRAGAARPRWRVVLAGPHRLGGRGGPAL